MFENLKQQDNSQNRLESNVNAKVVYGKIQCRIAQYVFGTFNVNFINSVG